METSNTLFSKIFYINKSLEESFINVFDKVAGTIQYTFFKCIEEYFQRFFNHHLKYLLQTFNAHLTSVEAVFIHKEIIIV